MLESCDTFVLREGESVWFGKNSDRPEGERQDLMISSGVVIGSQLVWSESLCFEWSANAWGVCIGNEVLKTWSIHLKSLRFSSGNSYDFRTKR